MLKTFQAAGLKRQEQHGHRCDDEQRGRYKDGRGGVGVGVSGDKGGQDAKHPLYAHCQAIACPTADRRKALVRYGTVYVDQMLSSCCLAHVGKVGHSLEDAVHGILAQTDATVPTQDLARGAGCGEAEKATACQTGEEGHGAPSSQSGQLDGGRGDQRARNAKDIEDDQLSVLLRLGCDALIAS